MQPSPFKYLPLIVVATALSGTLLLYTKKENVRSKVNNLLSQTTPPSGAATPRPTLIPQTNESNQKNLTNSPIKKNPAKHTVVDTALDPSIFYSFAGISYLAGLAAFIKAKKKA